MALSTINYQLFPHTRHAHFFLISLLRHPKCKLAPLIFVKWFSSLDRSHSLGHFLWNSPILPTALNTIYCLILVFWLCDLLCTERNDSVAIEWSENSALSCEKQAINIFSLYCHLFLFSCLLFVYLFFFLLTYYIYAGVLERCDTLETDLFQLLCQWIR